MDRKDDQTRSRFKTSICKSKSNDRNNNTIHSEGSYVLTGVFRGLPELKTNASADGGGSGRLRTPFHFPAAGEEMDVAPN